MDPLERQDPAAQLFLHLTASDVLRRVVRVLSGAGIASLPVKGVVTAHLLYASPSERPITDLDLRVAPEDISRVHAAGMSAGWTLIRYAPAYANVVFEVAGVAVDVEGTIGPPGLCGLAVRDMIARARPFDGATAPELHDHALVLVVNAFKDKVVHAAAWSLDDLGRIVRHPEFDVDAFVGRAREAKSVTLAWFVADWLARARGDARWGAIRDALGARPPRPRYQRLLSLAISRSPNGLATRVLARLGSDEARSRRVALFRAVAWKARGLAGR